MYVRKFLINAVQKKHLTSTEMLGKKEKWIIGVIAGNTVVTEEFYNNESCESRLSDIINQLEYE